MRILFVDDEPQVLAGLKRTLHSFRHDWEGVFVTDAQAALSQIEASHVDVIVADLKMPGIDGEELLERVSSDHPGVLRLMLSGEQRMEQIRRRGGPAHQYLSKPCNAADLFDAIDRAATDRGDASG